MTQFVLNDFLPYRLAVLARRVSQGFAGHYRERFGLTVAEWRVIAHLSQTDQPVSVREICAQVELDKPKVSRAASRLVAGGYVIKATNSLDRRLVELSLSDKGRDLMDQLAPLAQAYQDELEGRLGKHLDDFQAALNVLSKNGR